MVFRERNGIEDIVQSIHKVGNERKARIEQSSAKISQGDQGAAFGVLRPERKRIGLDLLAEAARTHAKDPMEGHQFADAILLDLIDDGEITKAFRKCC